MSRRRSRGSPSSPVLRYGLAAFGLAILLAVVIWWSLDRLDIVLSWLIAITLVTFLAYGYDKAIAGSGRTRVPERVLLLLAFAGGTIGALAGMWLFHHKTAKGSFQFLFWLVVAVQMKLRDHQIARFTSILAPSLREDCPIFN
jgi:uncharacterized membrane protein YsdA (DUF1294 family)